MAAEINYSIEEREGAKIIHLSGVLCSATEREFINLVESLIATNNVIINFSATSMVTSSGLRALIDVSLSTAKKTACHDTGCIRKSSWFNKCY